MYILIQYLALKVFYVFKKGKYLYILHNLYLFFTFNI